METVILFWFYKEMDICKNRLEQILKYNGDIKIYGLYGGIKSEAHEYQNALGHLLDDFYCPQADYHPQWKWLNGDLLIVDWFVNRGNFLKWDTIIIIQWDMLIFDNVKRLFSGLQKDDIFITYCRPLTEEIENSWIWTKPGSEHRNVYLNFKSHIANTFQHNGCIWCCGFILEIFPRNFMKQYAQLPYSEPGFLEYKVPTYAKMLGYHFFNMNLGEWYSGDKTESAINASGIEISENYIQAQLSIPNGFRLFHPYYQLWKF